MCVGFQSTEERLLLYQSVCAVRKVPLNIMHSRSEIEEVGLLKCLEVPNCCHVQYIYIYMCVYV